MRYGNSGCQVSKAVVQNEMYFGPILELDKQNAIIPLSVWILSQQYIILCPSLENLTKLILHDGLNPHTTQRPRIDQVKTTAAGKSIPGPNSA